MRTPEGTLERGEAPPPYSHANSNPLFYTEMDSKVAFNVSLPHLFCSPKDECDNISCSIKHVQDELGQFNLHKSVSAPSVVLDIPLKTPPYIEDSSPETPQQPVFTDFKSFVFKRFSGCFGPFFSIIGKANHKNGQDSWEIPFEQITNLTFLGSGGQGAVFSGILNNEQVAVKKVNDIQETDIKNLRKLNHPNIVKFKGVCTQSPCYSIVMEFCPYGNLFDLLKNQKSIFTPRRVVTWAKQIATGMEYLHKHQIIHRDLKSPNVLIGEEEIIKISDFGTSRQWSGVSEKMSFAGTVAWMPPEVIKGTACSEKVDIWSFGVVLWELLTCEVPYDGMERGSILYAVGSGKLSPTIPSTCPDGFKLIMQMCWKYNPKDRPPFKILCNHLGIASVEIMSTFKEDEYFKTQESWRNEIKSQFKVDLQKHQIEELQTKEDELKRLRDIEMKHIQDVKELYDRKLEQLNNLYLETKQQQIEVNRQQRGEAFCQCGRKRYMQTQRRNFNNSMRKKKRNKSNTNSTTPTSPEHSLTSPESPQITPIKTPMFVRLNEDSNAESLAFSANKSRKRHHRTNSGSPRISGCSRSSSYRNSTFIDVETQTDSICETDYSPCSQASSIGEAGVVLRQPQRVILEQFDDEGYNGNKIQLHYMAQQSQPPVQVFTLLDSRSASPHILEEDSVNQNTDPLRYSDEDNLETLERKVSELKNGNIMSNLRFTSENGNMTEAFSSEAIRQRITSENMDSTEDALNDTNTDEEGEVYNHSLKRRSLTRKPIYPGRRSNRHRTSNTSTVDRRQIFSDEGNTSECSNSPSSKSSTLESNFSELSINQAYVEHSCSSDSEFEDTISVMTQIPCTNNS